MSSTISTAGLDTDKPEAGRGATTASVRANFAAIKAALDTAASEITVIQAGYQPLDATLTALAGLTGQADRLPYFAGSDAWALAALTSFGRSLVDDADAAAGRATLGLGSMATQGASNVAVTGGALEGLSSVATGGAAQTVLGGAWPIQALGTGTSGVLAAGYGNNAGAPHLVLFKSRNSSIGGHTAVQQNDALGGIDFAGSDGTASIPGALIQAIVNATPGTGDMPTKLTFSTTGDGAASVTERVVIDEAGRVGIGVASPQAQLDIIANRRLCVTSGAPRNFVQEVVLAAVNITTYATILTITPAAVTDVYTQGLVEVWASGHTSSVGNGARMYRGTWAINTAAPMVAGIGTDITNGSAPAVQLSVSGNAIRVQVQSNDATNRFDGTVHIKLMAASGAGGAAASYSIG